MPERRDSIRRLISVSIVYMLWATAAGLVAISRNLPAAFAGQPSGLPVWQDFVFGLGTALSPTVWWLLLQALFTYWASRPGSVNRTGVIGLLVFGMIEFIGALGEPVTYTAFRSGSFDPRLAVIQAGMIGLPATMVVVALKASRTATRAALTTVALTTLVSAGLHAQATPPLAVPLEPVPAILAAFRTHSIVAISDVHGNDQGHALRLALIRDPGFADIVNDIVVESGNALYQDVMDRFVAGQDVPYETLRQVWHKTTVLSGVWDRPMYEELFRAVRAVNASLPPDRRLRVLLGDPPINWDRQPINFQAMAGQRESYPAEVIRREVLAKGRKALVIYGGFHLTRRGDASVPTQPLRETLIGRLERIGQTKTFSIWVGSASALQKLQVEASSWRAPSFAYLPGTLMGNAKYALLAPVYELNPNAVRADGTPLRMEDQYDAVVSLGWTLTSGPDSPPPQELIDRLK